MVFGRVKELRMKIEKSRSKMRERKIATKSERLGKELKKAQKRKALADQEQELRKLQTEINTTKKSYPTRGQKILKGLGKGALATGKKIRQNAANSQGGINAFKNQSFVGNSPLTKIGNSKEPRAKPRKKRVKVIEYE